MDTEPAQSPPGHTTTEVDLDLRDVALTPGLLTHGIALTPE
jgi:hypothetical protein